MKAVQVSKACMSEEMTYFEASQMKLHDMCIDMCKELGQLPERCTSPGYTGTTDETPCVMSWDELLTFMDDVEGYFAESKSRQAGA